MDLKHFRYGGTITHIGVEALPSGRDIDVVIHRIAFVEKEVINGKESSAWVCYFKKNPYFTLPMVLNMTNRKRIAKLSGTDYLETVKDLPVTLTKEIDRRPNDGCKGWCLRISPVPPSAGADKQPLDVSSPNFKAALEWVVNGGQVDAIVAKYDVSEAALKALQDGAKGKELEA